MRETFPEGVYMDCKPNPGFVSQNETCSGGFSVNNYLVQDVICCYRVQGANARPWGSCAVVQGDYPFLSTFAYPLAVAGTDIVSVACCTRSLLSANAQYNNDCSAAQLAGYPLYLGTTTLALSVRP